jgi:hypothetical protein
MLWPQAAILVRQARKYIFITYYSTKSEREREENVVRNSERHCIGEGKRKVKLSLCLTN